MPWTFENIPDQTGRVAIVTGANTGIGFETARQLALKGAHVVVAARNAEKGKDAVNRILAEGPAGSAELGILDLSRLHLVRRFAEDFQRRHDRLDLLVNNAGVMIPPESKTDDGFELQIGVNYFGHFAATGLLFPTLEQTPGSRVVHVSSIAHRSGQIDFDSFRGEKEYRAWREYGQSKLANLMFAIEMHRRLTAGSVRVESLAAHPGWTKTDLQRHSGFVDVITNFVAMDPSKGALPTLRAATDPAAEGGQYYGPSSFSETIGYPVRARIADQAKDEETARRLWESAESLTGVRFLSDSVDRSSARAA